MFASKIRMLEEEITRMKQRIVFTNEGIIQMESSSESFHADVTTDAMWKECLTKLILATIRMVDKDTGIWTLKNMLTQDIKDYCRPAALSEMQMAIELDNRRKFTCWVYSLFLREHEMTDKRKETGLLVYEKFLQQQSSVGKSRFYFIRPDVGDPLQNAISVLQSHLSMNVQEFNPTTTIHALPAVKVPGKPNAKKPVEPEDDDEEAKTAPPKKAKKVLAVDIRDNDADEPTEASVLVAAMKHMTDNFDRKLSEFTRDNQSRMDKLEKDVRSQGQHGIEYRERRYDEGRRFIRRDEGRRYERGGRDDFRRSGNQGSSNYHPNNPSHRPACNFNPCVRPDCGLYHRADQWKPDVAQFARREQFRRAGRCMNDHDKGPGGCTRRCNRKHGKLSGESQARENAAMCPHVGKSMCEEFFSANGCSKAHRQ
jgi:hypothetical protein